MKGFPGSVNSFRLKSALLHHLSGSCHNLIFYIASPYLLSSSYMLLARFVLNAILHYKLFSVHLNTQVHHVTRKRTLPLLSNQVFPGKTYG